MVWQASPSPKTVRQIPDWSTPALSSQVEQNKQWDVKSAATIMFVTAETNLLF